jgi:hypothetical protein
MSTKNSPVKEDAQMKEEAKTEAGAKVINKTLGKRKRENKN